MRYYSQITTSLLLLFAVVLPLAADAASTMQNPTMRELADNVEYMTLVRERETLQSRSDSIGDAIAQARRDFMALIEKRDSTTVINRDSFSNHILSLEQQMFALRSQIGSLTNNLNNIEREWIMNSFNNPIAQNRQEEYVSEDSNNGNTDAGEQIERTIEDVTYTNLIDNRCFAEALPPEDYTELRHAHDEELVMRRLGEEYCTTYGEMRQAVDEYMAATNEIVADSIMTRYNTLRQHADSLDGAMHQRWNHLLDTKYYAYGYLLEMRHNYELLDSAAEKFNTMQQQCSANDDIYDSNALMHYVVGHPTLTEYEIDVAEALGLQSARDSIVAARDNMPTIEYRHLPISVERRLFLDYAPIIIGRTNYYNNSNPLPELKVYERGTIYRILLGSFRSKQPMTLFKGVQPLYIDQDEDGRYYYYAGGFATRIEADEAQHFLRDKGFKAPEVCVWIDGEMTNISDATTDEDDTAIQIPITGLRYTIAIEAEQLDDSVRELIESIASNKMLSRANGKFIIGTFTSHSEADVIVSVLSESYPELNISINEIELQ